MSIGFKLNPYDPCVANRKVNGSQCTVCWYVDDTKISHVDEAVIDDTIIMLEKDFGKMTVNKGSKHIFVGMNIELTDTGSVLIDMKDYLQECIKLYEQEDKVIKTPTPGGAALFDIDKSSKGLDSKRSEIFHHIVAKLLQVSKRARLDLETTISFLCTRVSKSTQED